MRKLSTLLFAGLVLVAGTATAHAQGGCVNSPECPTVVLAAVGGLAASLFRRRL